MSSGRTTGYHRHSHPRLIDHSDAENGAYISYSHDAERALVALRAFSRTHIYDNPKLTAEREKIKTMYRTLFHRYLDDVNAGRRTSRIFTEFIDLPWVNREYVASTAPAGLVRDYIAGMTDRYFLKRFEECVLRIKSRDRSGKRGLFVFPFWPFPAGKPAVDAPVAIAGRADLLWRPHENGSGLVAIGTAGPFAMPARCRFPGYGFVCHYFTPV